ncbi:Brefeldin A-inhibited guanine nucleotide-exchange protein 1 [Glycine max]|nr:Brefeldin A-inhibited guanine nucleotide-exchange protein 1 [Glycine max]
MSASQSLGGPSRCGRVVGPSLDKIIKNAAWRKHSHLVSACKSTLDKLESLSESSGTSPGDTQSPIPGLSSSDADCVLQPLFLALDSAYPKVVEPALECTFKLFSLGLVCGEINRSGIVFNMIDAICKSGGLGEEAIELGVLRVLLSAVRSPCILIRADCLIQIVRTCYNVYLGGVNGTNQICAKSVLAQIMTIVFTRVEEDSMDVCVKRVSVSELLEFTDKNLNEGNSIHFCQNFINEIMEASEGLPLKPSSISPPLEVQNVHTPSPKTADETGTDKFDSEAGAEGSKIREDGFLLFKNLCKLSMKFSSQQHPDDRILLRGKILSLELLKVVMDTGGSIWRVNERQLLGVARRLIRDRLPTRSNLRRRQIEVDDPTCPFCRSEEENASHLFFHCNRISPVWWESWSWVNLLGAFPKHPRHHFLYHIHGALEGKRASRWKWWWLALTWTIWKQRNDIIFSNGTFNANRLLDDALFLFLNAIKQYLCLSLLKNSALSAMAIFQLQCSIFMNLLSKFRSGLKKEIGMFFPMLILRVLENVLQPSFLQKMTVLNLLDKISQDPQIIIDIFVNYDCDVDASNIFERGAWLGFLDIGYHKGGLGIKDLIKFNEALLGKWGWELANNQNQPWARILLSKYGGWKDLISGRNNSIFSHWWKDLKVVFQQQDNNSISNNLKWRVGCGVKIRTTDFYNQLNWEFVEDRWEWKLNWRRNFFDHEIDMVAAFLAEIENIHIQQSSRDFLIWKADPSGIYSTKSAYKLLQEADSDAIEDSASKIIWNLKIPPRAIAFSWRLFKNRLPTRANLRRRQNVMLEAIPWVLGIVNGLLKTALGPPTGSTTALSPAQDITFRHESVKCLVSIIKSMGAWMDQQIRIGDLDLAKSPESSSAAENHLILNVEEGNASDHELHSDVNSEFSDAATLEQHRAYKIELQKGISLFNRKPPKGIEFLISNKKIGCSPEQVALFLKNTAGLDETKIGDYLGEREEFSLKVMHAYVDSFNFKGMDFGEAIRFFLQGFRLPGEAQKIDRIMEKFAERYCKCNPSSFSSADTAYVLAYSVIMLNTDAHNNMVKDKVVVVMMTKADFVRNNRGIDDGKDLPEEYLGALYDQIVKNEIKMNADSSAPQNKQANSFNRLLGLEGILNLVNWKQSEEKAVGANGLLIRHIQEQFKTNSRKSESAYHVVTDVAILRFMVEVCWGPMLAAFSVTLDQSDDRVATSQCLQGFRHAVHVTAVMGMQTQRDAFVTSVAKFTYLHCAGDMKQKNVDAVKAIISIAIEDGDHLYEAWEHILTCLSRIEHLQLLGEGAPSDATFFTSTNLEMEEKALKTLGFSSFKKGTLQNPAMVAVVRGSSYDSTSIGVNASAILTTEQINNFISNLNLLDQIGNFELNHVFAHSQRLNGEAIVAFVKALCKVSISELQSPTDPRNEGNVTCLKGDPLLILVDLKKGIVIFLSVMHYNMNRIRLVWSRIWNVLSDFFVSVGLSENLSVAIFAMDSLRQLAMKFLEREELANYNFQSEFLRPFVIVMQKSNTTEIRELIVRCISQMVLSRVSNVKSGWKSVFMVFTAAAADERKNIVLLAFETMEKIVRQFFPYITETETMTFTDCVRCLLTFTNSRFNSDVSLNAIAFLRFCAVRLADGGLVCNKSSVDGPSLVVANGISDLQAHTDNGDHVSFWNPLLSGLSKLTSDPRSAIRKSSLEMLFNILKDHGHLFSHTFWNSIFCSVIFPVYNSVSGKREMNLQEVHCPPSSVSVHTEGSTWDSETYSVAAECLIDLFVTFFDVVRSQLPGVVSVLTGFIRSPVQGPASTGVAGLVRLTGDLGNRLSAEEWKEIFLCLKDAAMSTVPGFMKVLRTMNNIEVPHISQSSADLESSSDHDLNNDEFDDDNLQTATYVVSRMKNHIAMQLLIVQVATDLYKKHQQSLCAASIKVLIELYSSIALHARAMNRESILLRKLQKACSILEISGPPMVHFENESFQNHLNFLQNIRLHDNFMHDEIELDQELVAVCETVLDIYLNCAGSISTFHKSDTMPAPHRKLPLSSAKKEEIAARTSLVISALQGLAGLKKDSFRRYIPRFFHLLNTKVPQIDSEETKLGSRWQSTTWPNLSLFTNGD